jgi:prevent-host-death family protein
MLRWSSMSSGERCITACRRRDALVAQRSRSALSSLVVRITGDTLSPWPQVSIRDLRNHGGEVVDRAARGEAITITRDGRPVAELSAIAAEPLSAEVLLERWSRLPAIDTGRLRADIDEALDARV